MHLIYYCWTSMAIILTLDPKGPSNSRSSSSNSRSFSAKLKGQVLRGLWPGGIVYIYIYKIYYILIYIVHIYIYTLYIYIFIQYIYILYISTLIPHWSRWIIIPTWPWQRNTVAPGSTFCVARLLSTSRGDATVANQVIKDIRPWALAHQSWARISGGLCS